MMSDISFLKAFRDVSGYDFSDYSSNSISRRLHKICTETGLTYEEILDRVITDREFVHNIVNSITVNTTELFRDPLVWIALAKNMYGQLPKHSMCTIWHIGCSTGLEVYSDLIMLNELGISDHVRVYATDINPKVLEIAQKGEYEYSFNKVYIDNFNKVMEGLGRDTKFEDYFTIDTKEDTIKVNPKLQGKASFLIQDLVKDKAPFPYRVDIVFLRNVMIYFNENLQTRILKRVIDKMHTGGMLVMGKQEDVPSSMGTYFTRTGAFYKKSEKI